MHDVIIIGGGPAGMTASIYAARKQLDMVMISPELGGQAVWASGVENYLGYRFISGYELAVKFEEHIRDFGIQNIADSVTSLRKIDKTFITKTSTGNEYESRSVVVASGRSARNLNVPGEREFMGKGVAYCATCDAPLYAGEDVVVAGAGNAGLEAAIQLSKIANKVYVVEAMPEMHGDALLQARIHAADNVEVLVHTLITSIGGSNLMEYVTLKNLDTKQDTTISAAGIFVEIGSVPNTGFVPPDLELTAYKEIMIDCANLTNIPGLMAAGDVTNIPGKQIIIAAGEGAKSMLSVNNYLLHNFPD